MSDGNRKPSTAWIAFLPLGMMMNVVGIVLPAPAWLRYLLMFCGVSLLLAAVVVVLGKPRKERR